MTLNDLAEEKSENLDAVFITKKHLPEAANSQYADVYLNSPVPIVFINSDKVYLAFIDKDLSYEDAHDSKSGDYLIGYYNEQYFGVDLYDHKETKETIEDSYSRVFGLIETAKNTGEIIINPA
ncbi:hypothetical protein CD798_04845 [Bacillaceae bacterium SAOS 7]|nr:hypothetical protein CD798_04845 [Bacillaceae bacterium SAOS 7]